MNAQQEDNELAKYRNIALDVAATVHIIAAYNANSSWNCQCIACKYMRAAPQLVDSIYKSLEEDSK